MALLKSFFLFVFLVNLACADLNNVSPIEIKPLYVETRSAAGTIRFYADILAVDYVTQSSTTIGATLRLENSKLAGKVFSCRVWSDRVEFIQSLHKQIVDLRLTKIPMTLHCYIGDKEIDSGIIRVNLKDMGNHNSFHVSATVK